MRSIDALILVVSLAIFTLAILDYMGGHIGNAGFYWEPGSYGAHLSGEGK